MSDEKKQNDKTESQSDHASSLRSTIIPALRELGIAKLTVHYDGSGDEGRLGDIEIEPEGLVLPEKLEDSLRDEVDALLTEQHNSWEDGNGATGTVVIDTAGDKIFNEHGWYVSDIEYSMLEF